VSLLRTIKGLVTVALLASCAEGPNMDFPDQITKPNSATLTDAVDIAPMSEQRCGICHNQSTPQPNWGVYQVAFARRDSINMRLSNRSMPPGNATQMTDEERNMVLNWIQQGAPR